MNKMRMYLKTNNQEMLGKVRKHAKDMLELHNKWGEFQDKYHVKLIGNNQHNGNIYVDGVIGDTSVLPGEWRKPDRNGVSSPFKRNREAWKMLSSMDLKAPDFGDDIPELTVETPRQNNNGFGCFINTIFFEHNGYVYVSVGISAEPDSKVWTRIKEWEYEKAREEHDEKVQS